MLTLHHLENSRSQRILWLLEELGVDYAPVTLKIRKLSSARPGATPVWKLILA